MRSSAWLVLALVSWAARSVADESTGASVFSARCAVCHGSDATGIPGSFPSLHEQIVAFGKLPEGREYLVMVVTTGLIGEIKVGGAIYRGVMPAQSILSEAEAAAVLSYLAADLGKNAGAPALAPSDIAAIRARHIGGTAQTTHALRPVLASS